MFGQAPPRDLPRAPRPKKARRTASETRVGRQSERAVPRSLMGRGAAEVMLSVICGFLLLLLLGFWTHFSVLFHAELSPKRSLAGTKFPGGGGKREAMPNFALSPPEFALTHLLHNIALSPPDSLH